MFDMEDACHPLVFQDQGLVLHKLRDQIIGNPAHSKNERLSLFFLLRLDWYNKVICASYRCWY